MKTNRTITTIILVMLIAATGSVQAQMSQYKFKQQFDQAFAYVLEADYQKAIPVLEKLYVADKTHGQVAFLLGMCQIKNESVTEFTHEVLTAASTKYDQFHQRGRVEDASAPAKVWFYLAEANASLGLANAAVNAYRNYMSCIPMASLEHKREVIFAIRLVKEKMTEDKRGIASFLASQKP